MPATIRLLTVDDEPLFASVPPDLFDDPLDPAATRAFLVLVTVYLIGQTPARAASMDSLVRPIK